MLLSISEQEHKLINRLLKISFLYQKHHLTQAQIAQEVKIHQTNVGKDIRKLGLHQQHRENILSQISFFYQQGLTHRQIAHKLKISPATVGRNIKKLGLTKRKHSRIGEVRPPRYNKYRYCKHCKWIPIKDAKTNCPNCNSKLRNSRKSRKKVKRL